MQDSLRRKSSSSRLSGGGGPLSLSMSGMNAAGGGGFVLPTHEGDGRDDGTKFTDLVWVPDEEKVPLLRTQVRIDIWCLVYFSANDPRKAHTISINSGLRAGRSTPALTFYAIALVATVARNTKYCLCKNDWDKTAHGRHTYLSGRKFKDRLAFITIYKRFLYFRP